MKAVQALGLHLLAKQDDLHTDPAKESRRLVGAVDAVVIEGITNHGDTAAPVPSIRREVS